MDAATFNVSLVVHGPHVISILVRHNVGVAGLIPPMVDRLLWRSSCGPNRQGIAVSTNSQNETKCHCDSLSN